MDFEENGIANQLILLALEAIICFAVLIAIEHGLFRRLTAFVKNHLPFNKPTIIRDNNSDAIDDDVAAAKHYIDSLSASQMKREIMVLRDVSKYYGSFIAVNDVSFLVKKYVFSSIIP